MEIKLTKIGKHKIEVIKLIRLFSGLGLKESKDIVDNIPFTFRVSKPEFDFEQIDKNFSAIGAKIEKVEAIKKVVIPKPGEDTNEKPLKPKSHSKAYTYKKDKRVWNKSKSEKAHDKNWDTLKRTLSTANNLDDKLFAEKIQQSLFIAIAASALSSGLGFYFGVSLFISFSIVGIATAIPLKGISPQAPKDAGVLAAAFTLFAYVISPVFNGILYFIQIGDTWFLSSSNFIFRYFSIIYPSVFIPVIIAFVVAYKLNGKNSINRNKEKSHNKTYKKDTKSLRRKNRKLD